MIRVKNVTKRYGNIVAIDDISFQVDKGDVLGFLGPNGAGKTTTMRIITGYMPPTDGEVFLGDCNLMEKPLEAKKQIGYLPENLPLYNDLTVESYLDFVADIKNVSGRDKKNRKESVMERCGILDVRNRIIGHLSKGYRQRVGIAQALINDPTILVLDEPTIGLDPKQITEIRELIKSLAGDRTVILSTHMLQEVNMICTRVVIINKGRIVLEESLDNLTRGFQGSNNLILKIRYKDDQVKEALMSLPYVSEAREQTLGEFVIRSEENKDIREELSRFVIENGWGLLEIRPLTQNLEDIFLRVITKEGE
ncbi:MAG: ATP-binding cassette domain-containing protein [Thermodesulfobacteriota bacterium]